nr:retrovirus-related Pol polyprotein from transposon TNT 1-94 [Tanacetum cinerariifolium]
MTYANFKLQEEKTHLTILLCLLDEVLNEVDDEETTKGVWKKLETIHMRKSLTNKLLLKQRLFSLRMKEGSLLKENLDALNSILMDLQNVQVKIKDEDAALVLLVSLPPSFESFVSSFVFETDHWKIDCLKFKEKALVATTARDNSCYSGFSFTVEIVMNVFRTPKGRLRLLGFSLSYLPTFEITISHFINISISHHGERNVIFRLNYGGVLVRGLSIEYKNFDYVNTKREENRVCKFSFTIALRGLGFKDEDVNGIYYRESTKTLTDG